MDNKPGELLNINGKKITEGVSLITAVKNREETLRQALPTWLDHPEIDEIVIIDWSSDHSLEQLAAEYHDDRIVLVTVMDQARWILSYACNLAARFASRTRLLRIDADVKIMPGFFAQHRLLQGNFFTGNWKLARNENETHLNGMAFFYRSDFFNVNGYNEFITTYGWDDSDLYDRLMESGLTRSDINPETLYHMPHENRVIHQAGTHFIKNIDDKERAVINILMNRYIASNFRKWGLDCNMVEFQTEEAGTNRFTCHLTDHYDNIIPEDLLEKSESVAIRERLEQIKITFSEDLFRMLNKNDLIAIYRLYFLSRPDPTLEPDAHRMFSKLLKINPSDQRQANAELNELRKKLKELEDNLQAKEDKIRKLETTLTGTRAEMNLIKNSRTYRYGSVFAKLIGKIFPQSSR